MHIEPGIVEGTKMLLGYGTASAVIGAALRVGSAAMRAGGTTPMLLRSMLAALIVFGCFEVLPHRPVGVSEVHLILGTTLYLLFGLAPAAFGLASGLLVQGLFFAPTDLPQYGMNVTTLLAPLFAMHFLARRIVPSDIPYVDLDYAHVLKLSIAFQGGIVAWVAFWALYGRGFGAENLVAIGRFGLSYLSVILVEPLIDLAVLAAAKSLHALRGSPIVHERLFRSHAH